MATLLPILLAGALVPPPAQGNDPLPRDIVVVSSRPLKDQDRSLLRQGSLKSGADVPNFGHFGIFEKKGRTFAIGEEFLRTRPNELQVRALKRLGEIWRPGAVLPLQGETDLRLWLSQYCPPQSDGKPTTDAPVFNLNVAPTVRLRSGDRTIDVRPIPTFAFEGVWPAVKTKPTRVEGDDQYDPTMPVNMAVDLAAMYHEEETVTRLALVAEILRDWQKEQERKAREAGAAFFRRSEEALRSQFGGELPIGRKGDTLQPGVREMLIKGMTGLASTFGFRDEAEAKGWLASATIVSITPKYSAIVPGHLGGQAGSYAFDISSL